ncbi:MAG: hypothetical protein HY062_15185 [Bacteroidetes bacterium]|nr:hypothetical protein [Bacteroidota bacterium]
MFKIQNRIIAIDDNEAHLIQLGKEFLNCGLGCRTIKYDSFQPEALKNVRIAFFDINLFNKNLDLNQLEFNYENDPTLRDVFNDLSIAIQNTISIDNGPFALIFWTSNTILIDNFIKYVNDRQLNLPKPVIIGGINKENFNNGVDNNGLSLKDSIFSILNHTATNLLFDFEEKSFSVTSEIISQICNLIPNNSTWGSYDDFNSNFDAVFSKIAIHSLGPQHAKDYPDKAIYEALSPIIANSLINKATGNNWKEKLNKLANSTKENPASYPAGFETSKLNSIFHVDESLPIDYTKRGAVFEYLFTPTNTNRFEYFKHLKFQSEELFYKFFRFANGVSTEEKEQLILQSKFVVIEISASCDYSQNKHRNNKYVLGLLTPPIEDSKINYAHISEAVFYKDLPIISVKGQNWKAWINFNYSISDFELNENIIAPIFCFKKEIMDMIGNRYANHVSRIGITSF